MENINDINVKYFSILNNNIEFYYNEIDNLIKDFEEKIVDDMINISTGDIVQLLCQRKGLLMHINDFFENNIDIIKYKIRLKKIYYNFKDINEYIFLNNDVKVKEQKLFDEINYELENNVKIKKNLKELLLKLLIYYNSFNKKNCNLKSYRIDEIVETNIKELYINIKKIQKKFIFTSNKIDKLFLKYYKYNLSEDYKIIDELYKNKLCLS